MRGASRASLAEAVERLEAVATPRSAATIGDELFAVALLLDSQHALRRALTDPARPPRSKEGLVAALFGGRVSAETLDLLTGLARARWSAPRDLSDAVEELAARAVVITAEQAGKLDDLEDELFRFSRVVAAQPQLTLALSDPYLPADRKRGLLDALLEGKVSQPALRLITQAVLEPRGRSLEGALDGYAKLAAARRQRLVAVVRAATPLSQRQQERLAAALAELYGHQVYLNVVLDPTVTGGISVQVGDEFIDATIASRLAALRRRLAG